MLEKQTDSDIFGLFEFKPRKGDLKKLEIIAATIDCLGEVGIEKTSYESIAQKLGTRRAHVAYHFTDKHDIFKAAIRYILATYQKLSMDGIKSSTSGQEMLENYVEAVFEWAKNYPRQLSVMLLFYHLCHIRNDYRDINDHIKRGGIERLSYILTNKLDQNMSAEEARFLSKSILNLTSSTIIECTTTYVQTMEEGKRNVLKALKRLLVTTH